MDLAKTHKSLIIFPLFIAVVFGVGIAPAHAAVTATRSVSPSNFVLNYQKNQGSTVTIRAVPAPQMALLTSADFTDLSLITHATSYDVKLSGVNYAIKKPQAFERYVEGKITQESKALGYTARTLTPRQLAEVALRVTRGVMRYDERLVRASKTYDKKLDATINAMPLDELAMTQGIGVCRHFAALYVYVAQRIIDTSGSPHLKTLYVDEVVSYDFNHAFAVLINTGKDTKGTRIVELAFVDPSEGAGKSTLKVSDALDEYHDALFAELVKSRRWQWSDDEKESLLKSLMSHKAQGDLSVLQASNELVELYSNTILMSRTASASREKDVARLTDTLAEVDGKGSVFASVYTSLTARYRANLSYFQEIQSILPRA